MSQESSKDQSVTTFWDHLEELRYVLVRVVVATVVAAIVTLFCKEELFSLILAPKNHDFITYRLLSGYISSEEIGTMLSRLSGDVELISTQLTQQFTTHITMSLYVGLLIAFPYVLYELFRFISPGLYRGERRYAGLFVVFGYVMFMAGVVLNYLLIFPLSLNFLSNYQVSPDVRNLISLESYIGTFMSLNIMMGILFEMPILCWLFAKLGVLRSQFMRHYRRHAIVLLLFIAAIVTPTVDIITLILVALPIYLLYELSILIVHLSQRDR